MLTPETLAPYALPGLSLMVLTPVQKERMMALQSRVLSGLPHASWYYPSEEWEFDAWLSGGEAVGYLEGETLCGYAVITPAKGREGHSYARVLGQDAENTFDFHDVMVAPEYRRRGMHGRFLALFSHVARSLGGRAIYATVDPENGASWRNFEREGYRCVCTQPAYDGRLRRYYRKEL